MIISRSLLFCIALLLVPSSSSASVVEDPLYQEALEKFQAQDFKSSHRLFKRLQERYPDEPALLNNLAVVAAKMNQPEVAIQLLELAIASHPSIAVSYTNLRALYAYRASQEYKKTLALDTLNLAAPQLALIGLAAPEQAPQPTPDELVLAERALETSLVEEEATDSVSRVPKEEIVAHLKQWAEAWSRQDLEAYFNSYTQTYQPRSGGGHPSWRRQRQQRISAPSFIKVQISELSITAQTADRVTVIFKQQYQSNLLRSTVIKKLGLQKTAAGWKINAERVTRRD